MASPHTTRRAMAASEAVAPGILPVAPDDAGHLWPLSVEAGWNQIAADWRLMIGVGRAFGIRDAEGAWIASALALPLGAALWWISMVLVKEARRGAGLGTRLLSRCIAEAQSAGAAVGLDATELGRPIYLPLGFRDAWPLSRWSTGGGRATRTIPAVGIKSRPLCGEDLPRIFQYDAAYTRLTRPAILADLVARAPHLARVAERADGGLAGYVLGRDGYRAWQIGPLIAEDEAVAAALMADGLARGPGAGGLGFAAPDAPL